MSEAPEAKNTSREALQALRQEYHSRPLQLEGLEADPLAQFRLWFQEAVAHEPFEANAFTLATCTPDGRPSARILLLKELDDRGFTFFTNYEGRKGRELTANPQAAMVFFWPGAHRQVRIEGEVERLSAEESDSYFASRPEGAQIGAWASAQSQPLSDEGALERARQEAQQRFAGSQVPRPPFWGGYRLLPRALEFWQGRPSRLHDRFAYTAQPGAVPGWSRVRLSP